MRIRFGPPLDFSRYAGLAGDRFVERAVTDEIMYELMELSGREYVDIYAQKVKQPVRGQLAPPDARPPAGPVGGQAGGAGRGRGAGGEVVQAGQVAAAAGGSASASGPTASAERDDLVGHVGHPA